MSVDLHTLTNAFSLVFHARSEIDTPHIFHQDIKICSPFKRDIQLFFF